jgi:multisite-specific tRNA:(cytosine-C5)-methyltransferase
LTNEIIKTIVEHNDYTRLRIINCGTKVFTKQDGGRGVDASFRVLGEGLPVVLPYIRPETIMDCDIGILKTLLSVYYPLCAAFPEPFKGIIEAWGGRSVFASRVILRYMLVTESGSHVVRCPPEDLDSTAYGLQYTFLLMRIFTLRCRLTHELFLPIWKSNVSLTLMIDKKAKRYVAEQDVLKVTTDRIVHSALSLRLFGEDVTIAAREAAVYKKSGQPAPNAIDNQIDGVIPEADIEESS